MIFKIFRKKSVKDSALMGWAVELQRMNDKLQNENKEAMDLLLRWRRYYEAVGGSNGNLQADTGKFITRCPCEK